MDQETRHALEEIRLALRRIEHRQEVELYIKEIRDMDSFGTAVIRTVKKIHYTPEGVIVEI